MRRTAFLMVWFFLSCLGTYAQAQTAPTVVDPVKECSRLRNDALDQAGQWQSIAAKLDNKSMKLQDRVEELEKQIAEMGKKLTNHKEPVEPEKEKKP